MFFGRRPASQPDYGEALRALRGFVGPFRQVLNPLLVGLVENGFKVEKHGGFGLGHTFCNDDTVGRNYHVLMQIAYVLWQVFDTGVLPRLSEGCRKPTQEMWAKLLFLALLVVGLASVPRVAVGKFRMRRFHLIA